MKKSAVVLWIITVCTIGIMFTYGVSPHETTCGVPATTNCATTSQAEGAFGCLFLPIWIATIVVTFSKHHSQQTEPQAQYDQEAEQQKQAKRLEERALARAILQNVQLPDNCTGCGATLNPTVRFIDNTPSIACSYCGKGYKIPAKIVYDIEQLKHAEPIKSPEPACCIRCQLPRPNMHTVCSMGISNKCGVLQQYRASHKYRANHI